MKVMKELTFLWILLSRRLRARDGLSISGVELLRELLLDMKDLVPTTCMALPSSTSS